MQNSINVAGAEYCLLWILSKAWRLLPQWHCWYVQHPACPPSKVEEEEVTNISQVSYDGMCVCR